MSPSGRHYWPWEVMHVEDLPVQGQAKGKEGEEGKEREGRKKERIRGVIKVTVTASKSDEENGTEVSREARPAHRNILWMNGLPKGRDKLFRFHVILVTAINTLTERNLGEKGLLP